MNIAFDAHPLISDKMTGIGYCEAGLVNALINEHSENTYYFDYFSFRNREIKEKRLEKYIKNNCRHNCAVFSGFAYRAAINFIPVPYRLFFGNKSQITHFFNYIVPPGVSGKKVVTVHDMVYKAYPETMRTRTLKMLELSLEKSMKRADLIVTDSQFSKSEIIKYFPSMCEKIRVVPCGVDLDSFYPETNQDLIAKVKKRHGIDGEYFLYLGTIEPRKNLDRLIDAYADFAKRMDYKIPSLVLAGAKGWLYESIFQKVEKLKLSDKVKFTQYVPFEDIRPLMSGALAFVFPSLYEGFGMPPLEAMACETAVLASDAASLPEVVGDCAVLADPYSVKSISDGLTKLYSDKEFRLASGKRGRERAKQFTWSNAGKILHGLYEEIMG